MGEIVKLVGEIVVQNGLDQNFYEAPSDARFCGNDKGGYIIEQGGEKFLLVK